MIALPGQNLTYTINYNNPSPASLKRDMPANLTAVTITAPHRHQWVHSMELYREPHLRGKRVGILCCPHQKTDTGDTLPP